MSVSNKETQKQNLSGPTIGGFNAGSDRAVALGDAVLDLVSSIDCGVIAEPASFAAIAELPVPTGSVDWVISSRAICLPKDTSRIFSEISRVLKPGGRTDITVIVADSEDAYLAGLRDAGLTNVTASGRYVYARDELLELMASDRFRSWAGDRIETLVGRVWNCSLSAIKPAYLGQPKRSIKPCPGTESSDSASSETTERKGTQ